MHGAHEGADLTVHSDTTRYDQLLLAGGEWVRWHAATPGAVAIAAPSTTSIPQHPAIGAGGPPQVLQLGEELAGSCWQQGRRALAADTLPAGCGRGCAGVALRLHGVAATVGTLPFSSPKCEQSRVLVHTRGCAEQARPAPVGQNLWNRGRPTLGFRWSASSCFAWPDAGSARGAFACLHGCMGGAPAASNLM